MVAQRSADIAMPGEVLPLALVALAFTLGVAQGVMRHGGASCNSVHEGGVQPQAGIQEPEATVVAREFDPMSVEVEVSQTIMEMVPTVNQSPFGSDPSSTSPASPARDDVEVSDRAVHQDWWSDMVEVEFAATRSSPERPPPSPPAVGLGDAAAPAASSSIQEAIEREICLPMQTPLLKKPCLWRSRTPVSTTVVRRSGRLATKPLAANPTRQAQNVFLKKMGIAVEESAPDADVKAKFRALLRGDMPDKKKEMVQTMLGGCIDFSMVELELDGLDEEDL